MELLQLRYFLSVAKTLNISQAAREHRIPQPAMSATISRLEKEVGTKLFDRSKNRLRLTSEGEQFFTAVQTGLFSLDQGVESLKKSPESIEGELTLLVRQHRQTVIDCISAFKMKYPKASFRIFYEVENQNKTDFDLVITGKAPDKSWTFLDCLITEEVVTVVPASHPLAKKKAVDFKDLSKEEFAVIHRNSTLWEQALLRCRVAGFEPKVSVVCPDLGCLMKYISSGLAITLGPRLSWREFATDKIVFLPLKEPMLRDTNLYRSKWNTPNRLSKVFRRFLTEYFKEFKEKA